MKTWKSDMKSEVGINVGDVPYDKGAALIYLSFTHTVSERIYLYELDIIDVKFIQLL